MPKLQSFHSYYHNKKTKSIKRKFNNSSKNTKELPQSDKFYKICWINMIAYLVIAFRMNAGLASWTKYLARAGLIWLMKVSPLYIFSGGLI